MPRIPYHVRSRGAFRVLSRLDDEFLSYAHIEAAIADPDRVVVQKVGAVFRIVGLIARL
ncbi:MAG: hypothetical protein FJZ01_03505 [Candidatus Sericytochromatia bacterium]|nr:hypothetical protein [Candidatus Tanganyikabacteria bacterium]